MARRARGVAAPRGGKQRAHVVAQAAKAPSSPLFLLNSFVISLRASWPVVLGQKLMQVGIDVPAARAHHQAFERRETHAGVDAPPALIAHALQPLPRCAVTSWSSSSGLPSSRAASPAT